MKNIIMTLNWRALSAWTSDRHFRRRTDI